MMSEHQHSVCTFSLFCCYRVTVLFHSDKTAIMSTASQSSEGEEDAQEIRQRAFDLLNRMGGPGDQDDANEWPQSPQRTRQSLASTYSSYQQQATGEPSRSGIPASVHTDASSRSSASSASSSFTEVFVSCVSDACKMASSEVLRTGYDNLKSVVIPEAEDRWFASRNKTYAPVSGTYQTVDIPTQGYRGRYSDNPVVEQKR